MRGPDDDGWKRAVEDLKREKLITSFGISVNRWEPANVLRALESGLVDSVQVVYNIFDQDPEDVLFPYCQQHGIAIIARVPFDEGSLTGTLRADMTWPEGDWRNLYFTPPQLRETLDRVDRLMPLVPPGQTPARAGLAVHPPPSCRDDHDPRDAAAGARQGQSGRQRWTAAPGGVARAVERAPLGEGLGRCLEGLKG